MHLIVMHLILLLVPGYELSSDEDEPPLQSEGPADGGSALDDMKPQIGPPIQQKPSAPPPFDVLLLCAFQAGIQPHYWPQYEKLMHICHLDPSLYTGERAGGAVKLNILHIAHILHILPIAHILHITYMSVIDERF